MPEVVKTKAELMLEEE